MLEYDVIYENEAYREKVPEESVRNIADYYGARILTSGSFSISFVSPQTIQEENRDYRGIDSPTDILTFALQDGEEDFIIPETEEKEWGDMLICLEKMEENVGDFSVTPAEELERLIVHGLLHLSGQDHATNDFGTEPMLILQEKLLKSREM